jgi:predicted dehydrogenase
MALDMTPEQRDIGRANFDRSMHELANPPQRPGITRRSFMKGLMAAGAAVPLSAAAYYGYTRLHGRPVKAALIGAGDEGGVLVGEHNPEFVEFIACCDVRPSNKKRIFEGEPERPGASLWRKGFNRIYGAHCDRSIRWYDDYRELLQNPDVEMVVIALPLHLHAQVSIEAMQAGKHVLCEKLMARTFGQCRQMIAAADASGRLLSIGHQRHYSLLYAQAVEVMNSGVLGEVKHIRALWHRNMLPTSDGWRKPIPREDQNISDEDARRWGYRNKMELFHWRLYKRTGGGLMAELGSHQLDACSIFLGKVHPLAVTGVGLKCYYNDEREIEDHVYCTFEFPGKRYDPRRPQRDAAGTPQLNDAVAVTYSSISTNGFESYGECVMGTKGTLIVQNEGEALLYPPSAVGRSTSVTVTTTAAGQPALDSWGSAPAPAAAGAAAARPAGGATTYSRGYREEMEHLAYCIKMRDQGMSGDRADLIPRCHGRAAMADAVIALSSNQSFRDQRRLAFEEAWFNGTGEPPAWDRELQESLRL